MKKLRLFAFVLLGFLATSSLPHEADDGRTYVLVHGAFFGGSAWKYVVPYLQAQGQTVYAPSLTGLGSRAHLASPEVNLDTHIQDIVSLLEYKDLHDVILVGWSYGGMVVTGVLDRAPDRLAHVLYLDADVPRNGDSAFDFWPAAGRAAVEAEGKWSVSAGSAEELDALISDWIPDNEMRRWYVEEIVSNPQPIETFSQKIELTNPESHSVPKTYVLCLLKGAPRDSFQDAIVERVRDDPGWNVIELPTNHAAPIVAPALVADILLGLAENE